MKKEKIENPTSPRLRRAAKLRPKVAIAMSGGVDSSVAVKLLLDQGYEVVGFMMKLWSENSDVSGKENACCDIRGVEDARRVANQLGIPFYLVDAREEFKKEVVDYFIEEYKNLRTPNPCVVCNNKIKFGWLLEFAEKSGCDMLATGHYARIASDSSKRQETRDKLQEKPINNLTISNIQTATDCHSECNEESPRSFADAQDDVSIYHLLKAKDANKDQSYFLYNLNQEQLSKILFPIGEYTKPEVREMAKKWNLPVHEKKESQEICFIKDKDYRDFLRRHIPKKLFKHGNIVDAKGNVVGKHEGLINYTIGQRKGIEQIQISKVRGLVIPAEAGIQETIGIDSGSQATGRNDSSGGKQPLYVIGFDAKRNELVVGEDSQVYQKEMIVGNINWINQSNKKHVTSDKNLSVKIRYRHDAVPCTISREPKVKSEDKEKDSLYNSSQLLAFAVRVTFEQLQRAITPGQSAVFYQGDEVLGGGIIQN